MTANQKLLRDFLQKLLDTIIIAPQKLEPVRSGTIRTLEGLCRQPTNQLVNVGERHALNPQSLG